jgi:hypothetical protein
MKISAFILAGLISAGSAAPVIAQGGSGDTSTPQGATYEETSRFLQTYLGQHEVSFTRRRTIRHAGRELTGVPARNTEDTTDYYQKISNLSLSNCEMAYDEVYVLGRDPHHREPNHEVIEFKKNDPMDVRVEEFDPGEGFLRKGDTVLSDQLDPSWMWIVEYDFDPRGTHKQTGFIFDDEELADRVARALKLAEQLCGAKEEPFD